MFWRKKQISIPEPAQSSGVFSTDVSRLANDAPINKPLILNKAVAGIGTMDGASLLPDAALAEAIPDSQFYWYASQSFIGYQACVVIAQNWLVDKACRMPARDAIRQGFEIHGSDEETIKQLVKLNKRFGINRSMREFIHFGRVYGIRVAIFKVDSADPDYYEKPFNLDGVQPGSYRGISQVDPVWCSPLLTDTSVSDPSSLRFYDPEFYLIGGKKYHRSHLAIFIPHPVPDAIKPAYQYGGVSLPQLIFERVYAAERTANEGPQLAMTKRTGVLKVNAAAFFSNLSRAKDNLLEWVGLRDNYGVKVIDKDAEDYEQFDTGLADLDATIMTQYQLVAAIANIPVTKLLGTQPKGFASTGEYESESYREELESIQTNDLTPMLERHLALLMRSALRRDDEVTVSWAPLDSPTAEQYATLNLQKAQAAQIYADLGAIDGMDIREQLRMDPNSDWFGLREIDLALLQQEEEDSEEAQAPAPDPEA